MSPTEALLSRLDSPKQTARDRWLARCPAHKDRRASLSLRELDDGRLLVHCFAGCEVESIVGALGLELEDLFPPRTPQPGAGRPPERRPFSVRELLDALSRELGVAWIVLGDVAAGRAIGPKDRKRAGVARERCVALMLELQHVR